MKVIQCINNNVAVCLDSDGNEVVVFGKGVGFKKPPFEIELSQIDRSYYNVDKNVMPLISGIPQNVLEISSKIVLMAKNSIDSLISSNVVFTLADHIDFAIKRHRKNMKITLPIVNDVEQLFDKEYKVGLYALKLIREKLNVFLPKEEAAFIALHIINAEEVSSNHEAITDEAIIGGIVKIVEDEFAVNIDKSGANYSRFLSHLHYLLKRGRSKHLISSDNSMLFTTVKNDYPVTYACAKKICSYLLKALSLELTDEEILYLMLHINRLCTREDCNQ